MTKEKLAAFIKQNWLFYLLGFCIFYGLKLFFSGADVDTLGWIMAPTARWVQALSGIPFHKESPLGYINHDVRFIIATSCSGVRFLIITFATLFYAGVHRMPTKRWGFAWLGLTLGFSYLFTIFVNGFRLVLSIYLFRIDTQNSWLTPERIHMIEGTLVYFVSLLMIYPLAGLVSERIAGRRPAGQRRSPLRTTGIWLLPAFFYFSVTLGIPLLNGAWRNNGGFGEYALLLIAICLPLFLAVCFAAVRRKAGRKKKQKREPLA